MRPEDLILHLSADGTDSFAIRVLQSPAGEAAARAQALPSGGWERIAEELERRVEQERAERRRGSGFRNLQLLSEPPLSARAFGDLEELGRDLFATLFPPPIRDRLRESLGLASAGAGALRLRIQMDVDDPLVARLHGLPWEYLFDGEYLGLRRSTPILRSLDIAGRRRPIDLAPPLRVLAVLSEPRDLPPLNLHEERRAVTRAWQAHGDVAVEWLAEPSLDALCDELSQRPAQVLHFLGHGDLDPRRHEGRLFFTGPSGEAEPVGASTLAVQLADFTSLRLVFLNACQTAATAVEAPFAGVATALLRTGVPAVLAMQLPIPDAAAIAFSATLYQSLSRGEPIDAAVTQGRLALHRRDPRAITWGIPVLYLRAQEHGLETARPAGAPAPSRGRRALTGAVIVAVAAGAVGLSWDRWVPDSPPAEREVVDEGRKIDDDKNEAVSDREHKPSDVAQTPVDSESDTPRSENGQAPQDPPEPLKRPSRPQPAAGEIAPILQLRDGEPNPLGETGAYATATFLQLGPEYVRLTVAPEGSPPTIEAVMGPTTVSAPSPRGTVSVDVLAIDWQSRTVTVRGRLQTER